MEDKGLNKVEIATEIESALEGHSKNKISKIGFWSFVAMIFMTVYGMANGQQIYYQMGYASITYVLLGLILFFIPYTFMVSEMSSAFHNEKGGILSWMTKSVGLKFGSIGAFMWYIAAIMWWFGALSYVPISFSAAIFGKDISNTWRWFGLNNKETTALIAILVLFIVIFFARKGIKAVAMVTNISMLSVIVLHILILGGGLLVFFMNGAHFDQSFHVTGISSFFIGPNKNYQTPVEALGFLVYVIFILGGMESSGGLVDKVKNPKKTVPKAMIFSGIIIASLYIGIVIITGMVANWASTFNNPNVSMANFSIYITQRQFFELGQLFGMSSASSIALGEWVNRLVAILGLIAMLNFPIILFSPIKQLFEGVPTGMIPKIFTKKNKHGVTSVAVYFEGLIVIVGILLIHLGGNSVANMYNNLVNMVTVTTSLPWAFIVFAYIKFKQNDNIKKEYQFFNKTWGVIVGYITLATILFADMFSIIEPILQHQYKQAAWIAAGPIVFGLIGYLLAVNYTKRQKNINIVEIPEELA